MRAIRAWLIDDEPLALKRLARLLEADGRIEICGSASDPVQAIAELEAARPDVIFLDIEMPGMTGFDLLARLRYQPLVIFTTAYNQYALRAFEVNSIDYLLKPIEAEQLDRAVGKLVRMHGGQEGKPDMTAIVEQLRRALENGSAPAWPTRLSSRSGERVQFIDVARVTHIFAKDKLTFAVAGGREHVLDCTIAELESRLDPSRFVRIHRSTIVNVEYVHELYSWFAGRMLLKLRDEKKTELTVARERVRELKERLGV